MSFLMSNRFLSCHRSKVFDVPQSRCSCGFPARVAGRCGCGDVTALSCFLFDPMYHPRHGWKSSLKAVGHTAPQMACAGFCPPVGTRSRPIPKEAAQGQFPVSPSPSPESLVSTMQSCNLRKILHPYILTPFFRQLPEPLSVFSL